MTEEQQDHQRRQPGRDGAFPQHAIDRFGHEYRLVEEFTDLQAGGAAARSVFSAARTPLTTLSVDALPFLMMLSSTERRPFSRTMFCWTSQPS